jgi:hypothetical protein
LGCRSTSFRLESIDYNDKLPIVCTESEEDPNYLRNAAGPTLDCGSEYEWRKVHVRPQHRVQRGIGAVPGALITLEMTEDEVTDGLICHAGEINSQVIRRGITLERDRIRKSANKIADLPIYIRDQAGPTIPKLHGELRRLKVEKGIAWVIVDYLQLMSCRQVWHAERRNRALVARA